VSGEVCVSIVRYYITNVWKNSLFLSKPVLWREQIPVFFSLLPAKQHPAQGTVPLRILAE
ncbi:MAG TPA: hypothetical protein PLT75_17880, partial [Spirochaetota bacterium]|nr:hypothetical protein [Spirochaetota bacterium]